MNGSKTKQPELGETEFQQEEKCIEEELCFATNNCRLLWTTEDRKAEWQCSAICILSRLRI